MINLLSEILPIDSEIGVDGHLLIGGCDVTTLAEEYGTPLYVYDVHTVQAMCREFVEEFGSRYADSRIIYASKAYLGPAIARLIAGEGLGGCRGKGRKRLSLQERVPI